MKFLIFSVLILFGLTGFAEYYHYTGNTNINNDHRAFHDFTDWVSLLSTGISKSSASRGNGKCRLDFGDILKKYTKKAGRSGEQVFMVVTGDSGTNCAEGDLVSLSENFVGKGIQGIKVMLIR